MSGSVKKNYIYNLIYQVTAVILPLITMPYVARVLGRGGIGINSYTNANAQYFIMLGSLGVGTYAAKRIATVRENKTKLKRNFWEIFSIQFIGCILAYSVFLMILGTNEGLGTFYFLQGFFILGSAVDVSWYFLGIENFKNASIRSFLVKFISVILIFIFVKSADDLWKYIFINSFTMFLGQLVMWYYLRKDIFKGQKIDGFTPFIHIGPIIALFIPQMATQVYTVLDKTMTGKLANTIEVAYYDQSQKIIRVLLAVVTSLGMVMLPRIANLHSKNEHDGVKLYLRKAFTVISFLAIPIAFGIMGVSNRFIPFFFGEEYLNVVPLTIVSSVMIIIIGVGNVFGTQYMLATGKHNQYTKSVCAGAIINVTLNFILIPRIQALGAVISTVIAEFCIASIQLFYSRKVVDLSWIKVTYKYWLSGLIMLISVVLLGQLQFKSIIVLMIQIALGGIIYFISLLILKDDFILDIINSFKQRFIKAR